MTPVVCMACGQRGKVASIPSDLACAACMSTDVDLDYGQQVQAVSKPGEVLCPRCAGKAKGAWCEVCKGTGFVRGTGSGSHTSSVLGPDEPMGLLPNDQPEMGLLGDHRVTEGLRCSVCFHEWTHDPVDPAQRVTACPKCGNDVTSAAGTSQIITARLTKHAYGSTYTHNGKAYCTRTNLPSSWCDCFDYEMRDRRAPADYYIPDPRKDPAGHQAGMDAFAERYRGFGEDDYTTASRRTAKAIQITEAVLASNPGMPRVTAARVAHRTLVRYPKVAAGR